MNRKNNSGSGIFLMEMMMAVCFFILCASTCIWAFAKADHASRLAADRNQAVNAAESAAEVWKLSGMDGLEQELGAEILLKEGNRAECRSNWDLDWQPITDGGHGERYYAHMKESWEPDGMGSLSVSVCRAGVGEELFSLVTKKYRARQEER